MYQPYPDVTNHYRNVSSDFVKHLGKTVIVVLVLACLFAALFGAPYRPALRISQVAKTNPIMFEQTAMGELDGQGAMAAYGPPYQNIPGTAQSFLQSWVGTILPLNTKRELFLKPLDMAATMEPGIQSALATFKEASASQQGTWEANYAKALGKAAVVGGNVVVPPGNYGPLSVMMNGLLELGRSGLMTGALDSTPFIYQSNPSNSLLFLQGNALHQAAGALGLKGEQWGVIKEEQPSYPGAWWLVVVTAIYQTNWVANAANGDFLALGSGVLIWLLVLLIPWIPGLNRLPRYLGVHRLIWHRYYVEHAADYTDDRRAPPNPTNGVIA